MEPENPTKDAREKLRRDVASLRDGLQIGLDWGQIEARLNELDSDLETYFALTSEP